MVEKGKIKGSVTVNWDETIKTSDLCELNRYSFT